MTHFFLVLLLRVSEYALLTLALVSMFPPGFPDLSPVSSSLCVQVKWSLCPL